MSKAEQIYFDGKCQFCIKIISFMELGSSFELIDLNKKQTIEIKEKKIKYKDLKSTIHLITRDEEIKKGGDALLHILSEKDYLNVITKNFLHSSIGKALINKAYILISNHRSFFNFLLVKIQRSASPYRFTLAHLCTTIFFFIGLYLTNKLNLNKEILWWSVSSLLILLTLSLTKKTGFEISPVGILFWELTLWPTLIIYSIKSLSAMNLQNLQSIAIIVIFLKLSSKIKSITLFYLLKITTIFSLIFLLFNADIFHHASLFIFLFANILFKHPYTLQNKHIKLKELLNFKTTFIKIALTSTVIIMLEILH